MSSGDRVNAQQAYNMVAEALRAVPNSMLSPQARGALEWRLHHEMFIELGLQPDTEILPKPAVNTGGGARAGPRPALPGPRRPRIRSRRPPRSRPRPLHPQPDAPAPASHEPDAPVPSRIRIGTQPHDPEAMPAPPEPDAPARIHVEDGPQPAGTEPAADQDVRKRVADDALTPVDEEFEEAPVDQEARKRMVLRRE